MIIAVHIQQSVTDTDLTENFNYKCFYEAAAQNPGHHFIFIFDSPFEPDLKTLENITCVLLSPQIKNRLLNYYWYKFKLPQALIKLNASVFIGCNQMTSLNSSVKQILTIRDLSFLYKHPFHPQKKNSTAKRNFIKHNTVVQKILVPSEFTGAQLQANFPETQNKIIVTGVGINYTDDTFSQKEIEEIKVRYTDSKDFFLGIISSISAPHCMAIIKAFSIFKKRLLSNMQLVLAIDDSVPGEPVSGLSTYKYRNEVKIISIKNAAAAESLYAAAYAVMYLPAADILEPHGLMALAQKTALITLDTEFNKSIYGDAALYTSADEKDIAVKMMHIYKEESLRKELISSGKKQAALHSWEHVARETWKAITGS